jgi:hypothetical protein
VRIKKSPEAFSIVLQNHRQLPVSIFSVKMTASGVFEAVTEGFSILVISKEQAKTLSSIFFSSEKQKIVKTISACTELHFYHK